jgi:hypothetical protein
MPLQTTGEIVSQIPNTRARNRAQTAAYLVGVSQDIPVMSVDGINQKGAVQACYDAMAHMEPDFEVQSCSMAYKDEIYKACWSTSFFLLSFANTHQFHSTFR